MTEEQRRRAKQLFDDPDCLNERMVKDLVVAVNRLIDIQERVAILLANLEQRIAALEENVGIEKTKNEFVSDLKEYIKGHKYVKAENGTTIDEMLLNEEMEKRYAWYLSHNQCCDSIIHTIDELTNSFKQTNKRIGRWTLDMFGDYKCSVCESRYSIPYCICPRCNTEMKTYDGV